MIKKRTATEIEKYGICNFFKSRICEIYPYLKEDIYAFIDENDPGSFRPILEDLDYPVEDKLLPEETYPFPVRTKRY